MNLGMTLSAAIFDLDGTLIDSLPGIRSSVEEAFVQEKVSPFEFDLRPLIGPPIRQIFCRLLPQADEQQLGRLERAFRSAYDSNGWRQAALYPNAVSTLSELARSGVQLFVATNKPSFATGRILESLELRDLFTEVLSRDSRSPAFRSKSEMLTELVGRYQLDPEQCLYIGDTEEDMVAGIEAGLRVALIRHEGVDTCPGSVLTDLADLLKFLEIKEIV